ncbi:hypothetical protein VTI74DRAFT_10501 [Chaetomium olivicolor]
MVLKRPELCQALGISSWTAVQVWLGEVVMAAYAELQRDYLRLFEARSERSPPGNHATKVAFVRQSQHIEGLVQRRMAEIENDVHPSVNKSSWGTAQHYLRFVVEAVALDRVAARREPQPYQMANKEWSHDPVMLAANMYELTDAICHNFWKPAETELWDSDDSDVPYTDARDIPGHEE